MIEELLSQAYFLASQSKDTSNQNGAVLVDQAGNLISTGINNFPIGVHFTKERSEVRPDKYRYFEHAERNTLYGAARIGRKTFGSTLYCPWAACCDCSRGLINAGVRKVVVHTPRMAMTPERWQPIVDESLGMLTEAGVEIEYFDATIEGAKSVLVNGELWNPGQNAQREIGNHTVEMGEVR